VRREPPKKKCPWCPKPGGCSSCSISDGSGNLRTYTLVPLADADRVLQKTRRRWLTVVAGLIGALIASLLIVMVLIYMVLS
jgi:hypothetical protein